MQFKKYKIAEKYHVAKVIKNEVVSRQLRGEEKYLFQRILGVHLGESIVSLFQKEGRQLEEKGIEIEMEKVQEVVREKKEDKDDIFVNDIDEFQGGYYPP